MDIQKFKFLYEQSYFEKLSKSASEGLCSLLKCISEDPDLTDIRQISYALATTYHETAKTWQPIAEYGKGKGKEYGKPDPETGQIYYGRGYVQCTWKYNYARMSKVTGEDLVNNPDLAMRQDIAYKILSYGMIHGSFTGVNLVNYINKDRCDYVNARRIINGTDKAELIASYAVKFQSILENC